MQGQNDVLVVSACIPKYHVHHYHALAGASCRALRRKIGGTKKDFWKEWVDVDGEYTESGYIDKPQAVTGLPFLIAVVIGLLGALAYVVSQTATPPTPPV